MPDRDDYGATTQGIETAPPNRPRIRRRRSVGSFIFGIFFGVLGALLIAAAVVMPLAVGHRNDLPLERAYGDAAVSAASRLNAGSIPPSPAANPRLVQEAASSYLTCAECHGATGKGNGVYGQGTYPNATDLTSGDAKEKSDAQLFWITKNGLSFTGMPAFGSQFNDQEIWGLVMYMRALQKGQVAAPVTIPTASAQQLAFANPAGNAAQQGAAVYFAMGCQACHGPTGNAPRNLAIRDTRETEQVVRNGRQGMPRYGTDRLSDADLQALIAYINTFNNGNGRRD